MQHTAPIQKDSQGARFGIRLKRPDGHISDGTLESIKWLALLFMVIDHVNTIVLYRFDLWAVELYRVGRLAAPLFFMMLAYNMARTPSEADNSRQPRIKRVIKLCFIFGLLAMPTVYWAVPFERLVPNILFNFCAGAIVIYSMVYAEESCRIWWSKLIAYFLALVAFVLLGGLAEYGWAGTLLMVATYACLRVKSVYAKAGLFALVIASLFSLVLVNHNYYAMPAILIALLGYVVHIELPSRTGRLFFYWFYVLHFVVLLLCAQLLINLRGGV